MEAGRDGGSRRGLVTMGRNGGQVTDAAAAVAEAVAAAAGLHE